MIAWFKCYKCLVSYPYSDEFHPTCEYCGNFMTNETEREKEKLNKFFFDGWYNSVQLVSRVIDSEPRENPRILEKLRRIRFHVTFDFEQEV